MGSQPHTLLSLSVFMGSCARDGIVLASGRKDARNTFSFPSALLLSISSRWNVLNGSIAFTRRTTDRYRRAMKKAEIGSQDVVRWRWDGEVFVLGLIYGSVGGEEARREEVAAP